MKIISKYVWIGLCLVALLLAVLGLLKYGTILAFFMVYPWILSRVTDTVLNPYLAKAIAIGMTVFLVLVVRYLILFQRKWKKILGYALLTAMVISHLVFLASVTKDQYFSAWTGQAQKYYTINPIDGSIQVFDQSVFDAFGTKALPITPAVARDIALQKQRNTSQSEVPGEKIVNFFDPYSGAPLVWHTKYSDGTWHFFIRDGFDPKTGAKLDPVSQDVMQEYLKPPTPAQKSYAKRSDSAAPVTEPRKTVIKAGVPLQIVSFKNFQDEAAGASLAIDGDYDSSAKFAGSASLVLSFPNEALYEIQEVVIYTTDSAPINKVTLSVSRTRPNTDMFKAGEFNIENVVGPQFLKLSISDTNAPPSLLDAPVHAKYIRLDFGGPGHYEAGLFSSTYRNHTANIREVDILGVLSTNLEVIAESPPKEIKTAQQEGGQLPSEAAPNAASEEVSP